MTTHFKVSICLPTCNRPELIVQCIDSCLAQTHADIEIVVGDHSKVERTQRLVAERYRDDPRVRCARIEPPLGQAHNVASLFERATGDKILLIHDDVTSSRPESNSSCCYGMIILTWRLRFAHLFAYNHGLSLRLYYHLLLFARRALTRGLSQRHATRGFP